MPATSSRANPCHLCAARRTISVRANPAHGLTALASRSHADPETETFLAKLPVAERRTAGSSLKFCTIAEGEADVYPRFGTTMEWDTAAGHAVLRAAGGTVLDATGTALRYGKTQTQYKNGPFVAWGDPTASDLGGLAVPPTGLAAMQGEPTRG